MKGIFKSKARKAFLTSAICLALSSTVFAMPVLDKNQTESTVKISGLDTKTGTVDVSGLGLVDWKSFGLANDETLKFVFAKVDGSSNIINRVTGTDMSTIAGHMISQGEGGVYLINPNGIVISGTARLDVGSLMLSTISFTENDPQKLLAAVGNNTFNMQDTKNGVLKIEDGAKINFYDFLALLGGKVQIADNVTISDGLERLGTDGNKIVGDGSKDENAFIVAGNQMSMSYEKDPVWSVTTQTGNDVTIGKSSVKADALEIIGNTATLNGTTITSANEGKEGYVDIFAGNTVGFDDDKDEYQLSATSANTINAKGLTMTATDPMLFGGKVDIADSNITATDGEIGINALNTYGEVSGGKDTWAATKDNTLTISNTTLTNSSTADDDKAIELQGGKVTIMDGTSVTSANVYVASKSGYREDEDGTNHQFATAGMDTHVQNSTLKATGGSVDVTGMTVTVDGKSDLSASHGMILATGSDVAVKDAPGGNGDPTITLAKDATNVKVGKRVTFGEGTWKSLQPGQETVEDTPIPVEPTTPTEPSEPVTPTPAEQKTVDENVAQGKTDMETTLADNAENRAAAVAQVAQKLSDEPMAEASKGAQVSGYLQAIQESEDLSSTEKAELQRTVIRNVEATAVADDHAKDKQTEAAGSSQEAIADTTAAAADVPAAADSSAEAATVTVDGEEQE